MRKSSEALANLGLVLVTVAAYSGPVGAVPITTFSSPVHFRSNDGPNSVGVPVGDHAFTGILNVSPTAATSVSATQGSVTRSLPFTSFTVFPTLFRSIDPFDPALTGPWAITGINGPDGAGPLFTNAIANAQLLPFAENLVLTGTSATPTLSWTLPSLVGFDVNSTRIFIYNDATDDVIANPLLAGTPTQFTVPSGLLLAGVPYVFAVILNDDESFGLESRSQSFTQTPYVIPEPGSALLLGFGLIGLGVTRGGRDGRWGVGSA
jgi:hypothetical protein